MNATQYDLDLSGGLMDEICRLVSPPVNNTSVKVPPKARIRDRNKNRRPGKAPNHDCCDSCKEGGDLLCCDKCPAAFHLQCHDPPLDEDSVPSGDWMCNRCRVKPPQSEEDDNTSTCSSKSRQSENSAAGNKRNKLSNKIDDVADGDDPEDEKDKDLLHLLAKKTQEMNPSQFELPKEMASHVQLPGSSKRKYGRDNRGPPKKLPYELDNGLVPLPAKVCFYCCRSCRRAPLLQCDYCPLLFHLDCLDPPQAAMPAGRWMCPVHPEHFLEEKFLTSTRLSERVKVWDKFCSSRVNQHAVKVQFLRKIHQKNPAFNSRISLKSRPCVKVPAAIKYHYEHRSELLTKERVSKELSSVSTGTTENAAVQPSQLEKEQFLSAILNMQIGIAKYMMTRSQQDTSSCNSDSNVEYTNEFKEGKKVLPKPCNIVKPTASVLPVIKMESGTSVVAEGVSASEDKVCVEVTRMLSNCYETEACTVRTNGHLNAEESDSSDNGIPNEEPSKDEISVSAFDIDVNQLDRSLINELAWQRIRQLLPPSVAEKCRMKETSSTVEPLTKSPPVNSVQKKAIRCVLTFQSGNKSSIPMCSKSLNIGIGSRVHVDLLEFGYCSCVSEKHACLFYDEFSDQYELLNYSSHGTMVDGVLLACDTSEKKHTGSTKKGSVADAVRQVNGQRQNKTTRSSCQPSQSSTLNGITDKVCKCSNGDRTASITGWEGSALLFHGSLLKFGCLEFIFNILEQP